jgi:alpha-methylacyl-CoA racemase
MSGSVALPLAGVRVLDFTTLLPGPLGTLMLAEAGAEVTKVEREGGEDMRQFPPFCNGVSMAYAALNRHKRILHLDLKSPEAFAVLEPLIRTADVVVEQFRPGVMDRLGLGHEALRALNPRLIVCSITGYGQQGPRAQEAGHDLNYIARTGLLSLSLGSAAQPVIPPALMADIAGGSFPAVINILMALLQRERTGRGCQLDIAMTDAMATLAWHAILERQASGQDAASGEGLFTGGSPRYGLYATADQRFLAVAALEDRFWRVFCTAIELDPAVATADEIRTIILRQGAAHWAGLLEPLDCCCCIVATLGEAMADEHFRARAPAPAPNDGMARIALPLDVQFRRERP